MSRSGAGRRLSTLGLAEAVLWVLVLAVPLVVVPAARDGFTLPKLLLGEWLALASLLVLAIHGARRGGLDVVAALRRPAVRAVLPLLAVVLVGWIFSAHREHVTEALVPLAVGCAAVVGWSAGLDSRRLHRLLVGLLAPAGLLSLLAVLQYHGGLDPFGFLVVEQGSRFAITSLAGNAGHLAAYLAIACVVGQAVLPDLPGRGRPVLAAAALVLAAYALLVTQTLTALAALLAGSLAVWACRLPWRRVLAATAAALLAAVLLVAAVAPLRARVTAKLEQLGEGDLNAVLTGRLDGWQAALWMAGREPVTGVGHGAYVSEYGAARLALEERGVEYDARHLEPVFANAHNEFLEAAAEWGLPGLAALAWALWLLLAATRRVAASGRGDATLAWGGLVALVVLAVGHFPFRLGLTAFPALLLLAWIFRRAAELDGEDGGEGRSGSRPLAWVLVALLAVALVGQTVHAHDRLRANRILNAVERVTVGMVASGRVQSTVLWGHLRLIQEAERLAPAEARLPLAAGSQYLLLQRPVEAEEQYRRSLRLESRPETWLNLGRAQWAAGDRPAAVESWVTAVRLHPRLLRQIPREAQGEVRRALRRGDGDGRG